MNRLGSSRKTLKQKRVWRKISSQLVLERKCSTPKSNERKTSSSPSEMKQRPMHMSVRRGHYYGSVEMVVSTDPGTQIRSVSRFRVEPSPDIPYDASMPSTSPVIVENPQEETRWYWKYFLGNEHQNFAGIDPSSKSPFFMSILVEDEVEVNRMCRAIMWTSQGPRRLSVPTNSSSKVVTAKSILQQFPGMSDFNRGLKEITDVKLQRELVVLEDQEGGVNCKFGVVYALANQVSDTQMLSNEHGDENFDRFVKLLGQRIELQDWGSYRGGLDTTTNSTGRESVYTAFAGHEIMFHVSTMLPYSKENRQQIERKRHVGNDIVNIIFEANGDPEYPNFSPTMMRSHFTHVFAVVTYEESTGCYRLWVFTEETVPAFGPALGRPNTFHDPTKFREFLLTKLINAEKAAFQAKVFVEKRRRTVDVLLKDMYIDHLKELNKGFHKVTDIVIKHLRSPIKKESPKESVDFCKYGELIKLEKMLSGDVSESVKVANIRRKQPWEPHLMFGNTLAWDVVDSDAWGTDGIVIATEDTGVIFVSDGLSVPVIEANAHVLQLTIREHFGLFLARVDKGKESSLVVFALADLRCSIQSGNLILRKTCLEHRIPNSKGCHLFATSDANGLRLNIVMCIGKTMVLLRWAFGPLGRIQAGTDLTNNFTQLMTVTLCEEAVQIAVYERGAIHGVVRAVALTRGALAVVDFGSASVEYLDWEIPRSPITALHAASDGHFDEILVSHQNMTVAIDSADDDTCNVQETFWSSALNAFVCRCAFILGFGQDLMEVRLAINGNLLCSMYMPALRVLSTKDDIVFAVDHPTSLDSATQSLSCQSTEGKSHRSSLIRRENKETTVCPPKRWDVYRVSGAALQMSEGKDRAECTLGGLTPQLLRNVTLSPERRLTYENDSRRDGASKSHRISSTASDSGCHQYKFDYSAPNSPLLSLGIDPFCDNDLIL